MSIEVEAGSCVLLLGPSGSGKSTLARCVNGLVPNAVPGEMTGTVTVCGHQVADTEQTSLAERVGLVFQNPDSQFVTSTVDTEVAFGLENLRLPPGEIETRISSTLETVGLSGFEDRRIDILSGGEKQRLAIACQLAMRPEILVLDEPTANLDPQGTETVYDLVRELARDDDRTLVLIEHQCETLVNVVDRVLILGADGRVAHDGTPTEVFSGRARQLRDEGVWLPEVTRLGLELRSDGHWPETEPLPVTVEEAVEVLSERSPDRVPRQGGRDRRTNQMSEGGRPDESQPVTDAASSPALDVRGLRARYDDKSGPPVLDGIDLTVPKGSFLAVVGPNGAGKSTLAKHCVGVLSPPAETVYLDGHDVTTLPSREISHHVGYVFQNPESQFVADTVRDELAYGLRQLEFDADEIERRVEETLERFDLLGDADANPYTLSHGEKRRLSVATMLVVGQDILVVDEPTYGQDRANTETLMKMLSDLHEDGHTVVVLTHDMRIVAEHAERVAVLADGAVQFDGAPTALFADAETLSSATLARPPLAPLVDRMPGWSGPATLEHCYRRCTDWRHDAGSRQSPSPAPGSQGGSGRE